MRKLLVTGGAGYVGQRVVRAAFDRMWDVVVLDDFSTGQWTPALAGRMVSVVEGDIRDPRRVRQAMTGCEAVVNLAAVVGDRACAEQGERATSVNVADELIAAALELGVGRFVQASTCSVYGVSSGGVLTEDSELNPVSLYARTKITMERRLAEAAAHDGLQAVALRFGTAYGWSTPFRTDLLVNSLVLQRVRRPYETMTIYGPDARRPFVHVGDMAGAIVAVLDVRGEPGPLAVYNVGGSNVSKRGLAEMIARNIGGEFQVAPDATDRRDYAVSSAKFAAAYSVWSAKHELEQTIRTLALTLAEHPDIAYPEPQTFSLTPVTEAQEAPR